MPTHHETERGQRLDETRIARAVNEMNSRMKKSGELFHEKHRRIGESRLKYLEKLKKSSAVTRDVSSDCFPPGVGFNGSSPELRRDTFWSEADWVTYALPRGDTVQGTGMPPPPPLWVLTMFRPPFITGEPTEEQLVYGTDPFPGISSAVEFAQAFPQDGHMELLAFTHAMDSEGHPGVYCSRSVQARVVVGVFIVPVLSLAASARDFPVRVYYQWDGNSIIDIVGSSTPRGVAWLKSTIYLDILAGPEPAWHSFAEKSLFCRDEGEDISISLQNEDPQKIQSHVGSDYLPATIRAAPGDYITIGVSTEVTVAVTARPGDNLFAAANLSIRSSDYQPATCGIRVSSVQIHRPR